MRLFKDATIVSTFPVLQYAILEAALSFTAVTAYTVLLALVCPETVTHHAKGFAMTRRLLSLSTIAMLSVVALIVSLPLYAAPPTQPPSFPAQGVVTVNANLRSGPGTNFAKVGSVAAGETVQVIACNSDCIWYNLDMGEWIFGELVALVQTDAAGAGTPAPAPTMVTATPRASLLPTATPHTSTDEPSASANGNLRSGPGVNYERVGQVVEGETLHITGRTTAGDWYQLGDGSWIAAFLVANAGEDIPAVAVPTAAATPQPQVSASPPASDLKVDFINPHYNCQQGESRYRTGELYWGYRKFQIDLYITNNGSTPLEPPWEPTRWIITDGTNEYISDLFWQWVYRGDPGLYPQPTIQPGQAAGWTFVAFLTERNQWVKAVEYEHDGVLFRQEFDLGPYGNAHNYEDCGEPRPHEFRPTATPRAAAVGS